MKPALRRFVEHWGAGPLFAYAAGILLPATLASLRVELMPVIGLPAFAVLFWLGPFVSASALFWSQWSMLLRMVWMLMIPVLAAALFLPLVFG